MKFSEILVGRPFNWNGVTYVKTTQNVACDIVGFHFNKDTIVTPADNGFFQRLVNAVNADNPDSPK